MAIVRARKPLSLPKKKLTWLERLDRHMKRHGHVTGPLIVTPQEDRPKDPPSVPHESPDERQRRRHRPVPT